MQPIKESDLDIKKVFESAGDLKPKDKELLEKAYAFAKHAHESQKRMNGEPYFVHVFKTAKTLAKFGKR